MLSSPIFVLDALIASALVVLALITLVKNSRKLLNQVFSVFILATSLWIMNNYYSNDQTLSMKQLLLANHLTLFFPGIALASLLVFVRVLGRSRFLRKTTYAVLAIDAAAFCLALTPLVVSSVHRQGSVYAIKFGAYASIYFFAMLLTLAFIVLTLARNMAKAKGDERVRLQTIMWTFFAMLIINFITNAILPYLNGSFALTNLGPLSTVIIVGGLFYSIAKHRLFDIQFFVIRASLYLLTLFALSVFCITPIVLIFAHFLHFQPSILQLSWIVVASVVAAAILQYVRKLFDRLTSKIFYRYYYDPQDVLDRLSDVAVHSVDMHILQQRSAEILQEALKAKFLHYALLRDGDKHLSEVAGKLLESKAGNVIVADELGDKFLRLAKLMQGEGLAVAIKLRTTHEDLGFMLLGYKVSGELYAERDVRLLTTAASEIAISLQNALRFEEIQNFNRTLQERVEDATRRLRESNRKLKLLDETKDDFISMASHQLRTPLTSVKGYISLVLDGDAGPVRQQQRKLLTQAFISSQRMVYLIADLLNVSRLKTGKFLIEAIPINLADLIEDEVKQLIETAESRSLKLTFHKPAHFPMLNLDETKTRQVIMNFIDNAIYYTPAGGHIDVQLLETPRTAELRVVDDGIGVPKAEQHHLFSKFYRAKNAQKARPDGTGLGLFMAKKVIVAQGGAIIFSSQEGQGSTFGFSFAKDRLAAPQENKA